MFVISFKIEPIFGENPAGAKRRDNQMMMAVVCRDLSLRHSEKMKSMDMTEVCNR